MFSVQQIKWVFDKIFGKRPTNSNKFNEIGNNNILICKKCVYWNLIDWKLSLNFRRKSVGQIVAMYNNIWCSKNSIKLESMKKNLTVNEIELKAYEKVACFSRKLMIFSHGDSICRSFNIKQETKNLFTVTDGNLWKRNFNDNSPENIWIFHFCFVFLDLYSVVSMCVSHVAVCLCFDSFALWLRRYFDLKLCLYFELLSVCEKNRNQTFRKCAFFLITFNVRLLFSFITIWNKKG